MKTIDASILDKLSVPLDEVVIVDVRTQGEYQEEHILNSVNIPVDQLALLNRPEWKDKILLFHCKSGYRTQQAEKAIDAIPCEEALCLEGGIEAWKSSGREVVSG